MSHPEATHSDEPPLAGTPGWVNTAQGHSGLISQLVAIRIRKGLKQGTIARRIGVSAPAVSAFENGKRSPTLATLNRYAAAVGARITVEEQ